MFVLTQKQEAAQNLYSIVIYGNVVNKKTTPTQTTDSLKKKKKPWVYLSFSFVGQKSASSTLL